MIANTFRRCKVLNSNSNANANSIYISFIENGKLTKCNVTLEETSKKSDILDRVVFIHLKGDVMGKGRVSGIIYPDFY